MLVHVVHCDCEGVPVNDWGSHGRSRDAQLHTAQRKRSLREELHRALDADLSLLIVIERAEVSKVLLSLRLRHAKYWSDSDYAPVNGTDLTDLRLIVEYPLSIL